MINAIGWIGSILYLLGDFLLARKITAGWWIRIIGASLWIYVGLSIGLSSIVAIETFAVGAAIYGIYKWRKGDEKSTGCVCE